MANSNDDGGEAQAKEQDEARASTPPEVSARSGGSERSSSPPEGESADEERAARHTERPVAHSVKPPPPAPSTKRGFVWVAMLGLFGLVGFLLREPPEETSRGLAARAPSEPQNAPALEVTPPAEPSSPSDTNAPSELSIEQSPTEAPVAPAKPAPHAAAKAPRDTASPAAAPRSPAVAARTLPAAPETAAVAPSAAPPAPFNHKAANATLDQSAKAASSCRRGTDPSGVARAVVSFAPTGRVTAAVISGPPFAGTETGSCIARTLRQAVIPAFTGDITTVAKTVEVQ